jgi:citrate lyase subunit beta / citryl-CoA lyase
MVISSGNRGDTVRSDCYVQISPAPDQKMTLRLTSKVESLYGKSIRELCEKILRFYELKNVLVELYDFGALSFVLAARLEAAIRRYSHSQKEFLFPVLEQNQTKTAKERNRRTRLYLPGNEPKRMINAGIYGSDAVILDLEDSVSPEKKEEARILVRNALCQVDFYGAERMVRINPLPLGLEDLKCLVPYHVHLIVIPKCEHPHQIEEVESVLEKVVGTREHGIHLMPIIETALGVEHVFPIVSCSPNIVSVAIGLEDYTADLGVSRTFEGEESVYARTRIVNAAVAAGIQPLDSVFGDFKNPEALREYAMRSKALGFKGVGCIHPSQVEIIHEAWIPGVKEIEKAKQIVLEYHKAREEGRSVVSVGSKMVDPPVVKRALKIIREAVEAHRLDKNWREYER